MAVETDAAVNNETDGLVHQFGFAKVILWTLAAASLLLYPLNIGPAQWFSANCDANSLVYLSAQMLIAASMLAMSTASPFLTSQSTRTRIINRLGLAPYWQACALQSCCRSSQPASAVLMRR